MVVGICCAQVFVLENVPVILIHRTCCRWRFWEYYWHPDTCEITIHNKYGHTCFLHDTQLSPANVMAKEKCKLEGNSEHIVTVEETR